MLLCLFVHVHKNVSEGNRNRIARLMSVYVRFSQMKLPVWIEYGQFRVVQLNRDHCVAF